MSDTNEIKILIDKNRLDYSEKQAEYCQLELDIINLQSEIDKVKLTQEKKQKHFEYLVSIGKGDIKPCKFFARNKCIKGAKCTFSHDPVAIASMFQSDGGDGSNSGNGSDDSD